MIRTRDFRADATNLARIINARAERESKPKIVDLDTDEFVHIHCGDVVFIVFRDVITAGSMYFECSLFGFFKEAYTQEITFAEDVDPDALELYLNLTHSWFFEIRFRGIRVVPADYFRSLIETIQEEPFQKAHLEIPKMKLRQLAEIVTLADRFLHRSLLCILRQLFLSLLNITHISWSNVKQEARDMDVLYHAEFILDYTDTFEILSMGHDDEKYLRNALTESFHWLTVNTPDLRNRFMYLMSDDFIAECDQDRRGHSETIQVTHAKGIFATDQFCYESVTRVQRKRRFKRVVNMCPFEDQKDIFPWVKNPRDRRIRVRRLHDSVRAIKRSARDASNRERQFKSFVSGTASHQASNVDSYNQIPADGSNISLEDAHIRGGRGRDHVRGRGRGRGFGRGQHPLSRGALHQLPTSAINLGSQLETLKPDPKGDRTTQRNNGKLSSTKNHASQWSGTTNSAPLSNQATKRFSIGLNPEARAFEQPSKIHSMVCSIRAQLSTGGKDALGYLEKQGKHAVHGQHRGESQHSKTQSNQVTPSVQPSHSSAPQTQQIHAQQINSLQTTEENSRGSSQKPSKYWKKKKKHQVSATAQKTGNPTPDITASLLHFHAKAENTSTALKTGEPNAGDVDTARGVKPDDASVSAVPRASNSMVQLSSDAKRRAEDHSNGKFNGNKSRGRYPRQGRGRGPQPAEKEA